MFPTKYEWAGTPETGDCSLRVLSAELEYDDGVWQCQVTPSSFKEKDALISEGAQLVVRGKKVSLLCQGSLGSTSANKHTYGGKRTIAEQILSTSIQVD
jgi:hypothetical protein